MENYRRIFATSLCNNMADISKEQNAKQSRARLVAATAADELSELSGTIMIFPRCYLDPRKLAAREYLASSNFVQIIHFFASISFVNARYILLRLLKSWLLHATKIVPLFLATPADQISGFNTKITICSRPYLDLCYLVERNATDVPLLTKLSSSSLASSEFHR